MPKKLPNCYLCSFVLLLQLQGCTRGNVDSSVLSFHKKRCPPSRHPDASIGNRELDSCN